MGLLSTNLEVASEVASYKASNSRGKELLNQQDKKSTRGCVLQEEQ